MQVDDGVTATDIIENIDYNAKGQRIKVEYGNDTTTEYSYDEKTFALKRLLTTVNTGGAVKQDLNCTYDPVGNITQMKDDVISTMYYRNTEINNINDFTYDAIYRLIIASGRELEAFDGGSANFGTKDNYIDVGWQSSSNTNALQRYTQYYEYDMVGNITELACWRKYRKLYTYL